MKNGSGCLLLVALLIVAGIIANVSNSSTASPLDQTLAQTEAQTKDAERAREIVFKDSLINHSNLKHPSWINLMQSPDKYKKENLIVVRAKILQSISSGYRMGMYSGKYILVDCPNHYDNSPNRPTENDCVKIIGVYRGVDSYTTVLGAEVECPRIEAYKVLYTGRQED